MTDNIRGVILLQTLIMVMILAMVGIMTLKWVLGRHIVTAKVSKSINCKALADACFARKIAEWGGNAPSGGWCSIENTNDVKIIVSGNKVDFIVDFQNCTYQ